MSAQWYICRRGLARHILEIHGSFEAGLRDVLVVEESVCRGRQREETYRGSGEEYDGQVRFDCGRGYG